MKIQIKLKIDALIAVSKMLESIYNLPFSVTSVTENVYISIGYDLADLFDKKVKTKIKKADLFDVKKETKFTLKYHEAWALKKILIELKPYANNTFIELQLQKIIDKLDQHGC